MEWAQLTTLHLVKIGQPLAPQQLQAGAAFLAVVQLPQELLVDLVDLVALPTITTILLLEACSVQHKNLPLELGIPQEACSAVAIREQGSVRPTISSKPVHSEPQ